MLQLKLTHEVQGISNHDTNVPVNKSSTINMVELVLRGEGLGGGFKGRSPNKATIWMGEQFRNVVLPEGYDVEKIHSMSIEDNTNVNRPLNFVKHPTNPRLWMAQQPTQEMTGPVPGFTGASPRQFDVRKAFKEALGSTIGEVGVNDLGYLLNCEIQLPQNHDNDSNREAIQTLAETLGETMGTPVAANIVVVGAGYIQADVIGQGQLGDHPQADRAMAGRHQVAPVNPDTNPVKLSGLETSSTT